MTTLSLTSFLFTIALKALVNNIGITILTIKHTKTRIVEFIFLLAIYDKTIKINGSCNKY